jgi:hypothetical protein
MNHFICSGWAYGTISYPLPSPLLTQILTVGWKLGSLLGYNHTITVCIMQWLRLHTHPNPKLFAHQCGAHIRCMNHFICSGWAYGTIGYPLPSPLLTQILTVGWKLGSLLGYKPYHYRMQWLRLHTRPKLFAHQCGAHIWCMILYESLHMQCMGIWNHRLPFTLHHLPALIYGLFCGNTK